MSGASLCLECAPCFAVSGSLLSVSIYHYPPGTVSTLRLSCSSLLRSFASPLQTSSLLLLFHYINQSLKDPAVPLFPPQGPKVRSKSLLIKDNIWTINIYINIYKYSMFLDEIFRGNSGEHAWVCVSLSNNLTFLQAEHVPADWEVFWWTPTNGGEGAHFIQRVLFNPTDVSYHSFPVLLPYFLFSVFCACFFSSPLLRLYRWKLRK